jgi:hypothetical protein
MIYLAAFVVFALAALVGVLEDPTRLLVAVLAIAVLKALLRRSAE